jgi:RNA-directed DNA polymerase
MGRTPQPKRMRATLRKIKAVLRARMHERVNVVGQWLKPVVEGYNRYHAVPGNTVTLGRFRDRLCNLWRSTLGRRSQRS